MQQRERADSRTGRLSWSGTEVKKGEGRVWTGRGHPPHGEREGELRKPDGEEGACTGLFWFLHSSQCNRKQGHLLRRRTGEEASGVWGQRLPPSSKQVIWDKEMDGAARQHWGWGHASTVVQSSQWNPNRLLKKEADDFFFFQQIEKTSFMVGTGGDPL